MNKEMAKYLSTVLTGLLLCVAFVLIFAFAQEFFELSGIGIMWFYFAGTILGTASMYCFVRAKEIDDDTARTKHNKQK